ncbi:ABC transporter ATP-binding protein [Romboutsia sp. Marseille-P6047]|uniref:ABC transporter ATP-binding protein n=1 Tax=Romboutsia sp. Marseille-P6047 TaxID=2161817 RepID=UPI000F061696|nr:ABC transporter ATP-binding protein [Romboutsia sp. Marseille-P6047]
MFKKFRYKDSNHIINEIQLELKWMYVYIKKYKLDIGIYIILGIVATLMSLSSNVGSKYLIDAVTEQDSSKIGIIILIIILMAIGNIIITAISNRISAKINIKVGNEIKQDIYDKIINIDWESMNTYHSGDLLNRLTNDTNTVATSVLGWIPNLITKSIQFISTLCVILYYDTTMAVIAMLSAPVSIIISKILMKKMRKFNQEIRQASSEVMSFNEETFQNLQSIKAFNLMDIFSDKLRCVQKNYADVSLGYNKFSIYTSSFMSFIGTFVSYACFGWGVYRLWSGHITYGTMTLFLQLSGKLSSSFSSLINLVPSAIGATTSAGRIMEVSELPREIIKDEKLVDELYKTINESGLDIEIKNVNFSYSNKNVLVLENANISANSGEIVALVGPSGEGKTTMMRILLGLLNINDGEAIIKDKSNRSCNISASTRKLMAYVPQEKTMFSGTIAENMRMVKPEATDLEIIEALKISCAYDFIKKLPNGINSRIGERGNGFSEGQNQRLSIARALLRNSPILLLDEATSALDVATERKVLKNIMEMNNNRTCIVTTHRPSVLTMCDKVYKISQCKVTEVTSKEVEKMVVDF